MHVLSSSAEKNFSSMKSFDIFAYLSPDQVTVGHFRIAACGEAKVELYYYGVYEGDVPNDHPHIPDTDKLRIVYDDMGDEFFGEIWPFYSDAIGPAYCAFRGWPMFKTRTMMELTVVFQGLEYPASLCFSLYSGYAIVDGLDTMFISFESSKVGFTPDEKYITHVWKGGVQQVDPVEILGPVAGEQSAVEERYECDSQVTGASVEVLPSILKLYAKEQVYDLLVRQAPIPVGSNRFVVVGNHPGVLDSFIRKHYRSASIFGMDPRNIPNHGDVGDTMVSEVYSDEYAVSTILPWISMGIGVIFVDIFIDDIQQEREECDRIMAFAVRHGIPCFARYRSLPGYSLWVLEDVWGDPRTRGVWYSSVPVGRKTRLEHDSFYLPVPMFVDHTAYTHLRECVEVVFIDSEKYLRIPGSHAECCYYDWVGMRMFVSHMRETKTTLGDFVCGGESEIYRGMFEGGYDGENLRLLDFPLVSTAYVKGFYYRYAKLMSFASGASFSVDMEYVALYQKYPRFPILYTSLSKFRRVYNDKFGGSFVNPLESVPMLLHVHHLAVLADEGLYNRLLAYMQIMKNNGRQLHNWEVSYLVFQLSHRGIRRTKSEYLDSIIRDAATPLYFDRRYGIIFRDENTVKNMVRAFLNLGISRRDVLFSPALLQFYDAYRRIGTAFGLIREAAGSRW